MKVTVIPVVVGALETVSKNQVKRLEKKQKNIETIQTTALLKSVKILKRVLETRENLLLLQWKHHQLEVMWETRKE